jgi:epoxyqueuosine reductase
MLKDLIIQTGLSLGFDDVRIASPDTTAYHPFFRQWVARGLHGDLFYMVKHGNKRLNPQLLLPETRAIIVVRMNYLPPSRPHFIKKYQPHIGVVARYAFGRDYHKVLKKRLEIFAQEIHKLKEVQNLQYRAFVDSGPVLEKPLAEAAGLGWQGKNGLIINRSSGSWFFIGTLLTNLSLLPDNPVTNDCGACKACIKICPTDAFISPKILDSKKCISYLTIEYKGIIPIELRDKIGQRIFGCDDCQAICPWNRYATPTLEKEFWDQRGLTEPNLLTLYSYDQQHYEKLFAGTPLYRTGYAAWLRNVAIAIGNAPFHQDYLPLLKERSQHIDSIIATHAQWALDKQLKKATLD